MKLSLKNIKKLFKACFVAGFFIFVFSLTNVAQAEETTIYTTATTTTTTTTTEPIVTPISSTSTIVSIPSPTLNIPSLDEQRQISGLVEISGQSLNFSTVEIYLDGVLKAVVETEMGTTGWGEYNYTLAGPLEFKEHQIEVRTKYFGLVSQKVNQNFIYTDKFPGPTLFDPVLNFETNFKKPWIIGLAHNFSFLEIYINNKLDGTLQVENHSSGIASFRYKPKADLETGFYSVKVRAKNTQDLRLSDFSNEIVFEIRNQTVGQKMTAPGLDELPENFIAPVPAPTLLVPESGEVLKQTNPIISGVVKNNHLTKIFIDGKLDGKFTPEEHSSGTAYFEYKIQENLQPGLHQISAGAVNSRGQISGNSNILQIIIITGDEKVILSPAIPPEIDSGASSQVLGEQEILEQEEGGQKEGALADWWKFVRAIIIVALVLFVIALYFERQRVKEWFNNRFKKTTKEKTGEKIEIKTDIQKEKGSADKVDDDFDEPFFDGQDDETLGF